MDINIKIRHCIDCMKSSKNLKFTVSIEDNCIWPMKCGITIGYIDDNDRHISVLYLLDNVGEYIALAYQAKKKDNFRYVSEYMSTRCMNGRHEVREDCILLYSVFLILEDDFLHRQIDHGLLDIWEMNNIAEGAPEHLIEFK